MPWSLKGASAYLSWGLEKAWKQWRPPPRRKALSILVWVYGEWSAGLKGGRHGVCTLQERTDCPLTRGLLVVKGRTVEGKDERVPQLPDRGKMRVNSFCTPNLEGVVVTDLSEESAFEAGRYAFAVWPRLAVVKWRWSSSFRLEGQGRLGGAEAAGLLGRFRSTRLCGRWRGKGRPRAPQTIVGEGAQPGPHSCRMAPFWVAICSPDKEEEGVEWSLILLGMICLRAADCVLAERNFSTTELTASPNNPDCEMGASSKNTFSFSRISVRFSHKWHSAATEPAIEHPTAHAVCLVALRAKSVALRSSFTASGVRPVPSSISLSTSAW